jgi:crotonobetainyl-CoA:carnitine CoA-transferase CaiB-like acyl-CoA transferase
MLQLSHVLNGITVIEIASYIPGPLCTAILAQLGATVVKIERPGGDPMRTLPPLNAAGEHPLFAFLNRSKQFRTLDLRQPADRAVLNNLIRSADVLIDGLRLGALAKLGFADHDLLVMNPRLLIVSIRGAPSASV